VIRRSRSWLAWLVLLPLALGGCGIFSKKEEPIEPPAELASIQPVLSVNKAWEVKVGSGSEYLNLGLRPAIEGGRVYAAGRNGRVHALDLETGRAQWTAETGLDLSAGPAAGHGMVVVGSTGGQVAALDIADGSLRWQVQIAGEMLSTPAITPRWSRYAQSTGACAGCPWMTGANCGWSSIGRRGCRCVAPRASRSPAMS
jgi:outer membrane protein assembly factor BamB